MAPQTELFRATEKGDDSAAKCALGTMFEEGIGVKRNVSRALALFRSAAEVVISPDCLSR